MANLQKKNIQQNSFAYSASYITLCYCGLGQYRQLSVISRFGAL